MRKPIPQGIKVLVLKAAIDPDFKDLLLQRRTAAAAAIGLELTAAEATMLAAVPAPQLEAVIARASVPQEHRRAFLGQAAAAMLTAMAAARSAAAVEQLLPQKTVEERRVASLTFAIASDLPPRKEKTVEERVIEIVADRWNIDPKNVKRDDQFVKNLGAKANDLVELRKEFAKKFDIKIPDDDFKKIRSVGETIDYVEKALKKKAEQTAQPAQPPIRPMMAGVMRGPNN